MNHTTRVFLSGLLALLPIALTVAVLAWLISILNEYVGPGSWFGRQLSSIGLSINENSPAPYIFGIVILIAAVYFLGLLLETRLGPWLASLFERLVEKVPVVSNLYGLTKRFTSLLDQKGDTDVSNMSSVWCFFGGEPGAAVLALLPSSVPVRIGNENYLGVLIPSAPVPVGGALLYVPQAWIKPADGGVENLMSVYVSMGVTPPHSKDTHS
ncbi:MAG: DUF502 domain-containing protein [Alphaproteobacteria bacterium]|nr:DUF502 domain-containing protein [Alphaproteobacteria bacterium]